MRTVWTVLHQVLQQLLRSCFGPAEKGVAFIAVGGSGLVPEKDLKRTVDGKEVMATAIRVEYDDVASFKAKIDEYVDKFDVVIIRFESEDVPPEVDALIDRFALALKQKGKEVTFV